MMQFRKHFGYDVEKASNEATVVNDLPSLTLQSQSEDCDINVLMERFGITKKLPDNPRVPTYGDFTGINDFRSALEAIQNAEDAFMEFPASVRARFENDPQQVLEFISDESNYAEAVRLGLMREGARAPSPSGSPQPGAAATPGGAPPPGGAPAPVVP